MNNNLFQNRLYLERKRKNYTQDRIAKDIGISRVAYSNIELGKAVPSVQTLIQFSRVLSCSLDYLVGNTDIREIQSPPAKPQTIYSELQNIIETLENNETISNKSDVLSLLRIARKLINE